MNETASAQEPALLAAHKDHRRCYGELLYVYPVISRRSRGVSIGINLNPDKICNFDCVYCEVDRVTPARTKKVDLGILADELRFLLEDWRSGKMFASPPFDTVPQDWRRLNDIAFSGDGEPTTCPLFFESVQLASELREEIAEASTKLVLITDAACLDRPGVVRGLEIMSRLPHEVWAKIDAGTDDFYREVNRTSVPFSRVIENILRASRWLPLIVQTLFFKLRGEAPSLAEVEAYCARLNHILSNGGQLIKVQLYTIARPTAEAFATALPQPELDRIASVIRRETSLEVEVYGGC